MRDTRQEAGGQRGKGKGVIRGQGSAVSGQRSAVSGQRSAVSGQRLAVRALN